MTPEEKRRWEQKQDNIDRLFEGDEFAFDGNAVRVAAAIPEPESATHEPPRPLSRKLPPPDPFPVNALGDILGNAARAINDRVQAPMAICGQSVLATATLAVQGHADIELPTGHVKPLSNFFLTIAETGERKTAGDTEALKPIREHESDLRKKYEKALPIYINAKEAWDAARKHATGQGKGDRAAIKAALDKIGPPPKEPLLPLLTCPEPTYEGLVKCLAIGQPSMGVFSDEGGQFIGGHGMKEEAKLLTASGMSALWDGTTIKRVRSKDGTIILPGRRVASHLMAQPDVAARMLSDPLLLNQGYLSRILASAPESSAGSRFWKEPKEDSSTALEIYSSTILNILQRRLPVSTERDNELSPKRIVFDAEAKKLWTQFADQIEKQIAPSCALAPVKGLANKLPEHAARLAAVLELTTDIDADKLRPEFMAHGITLANHYVAEALRIFEAGLANPDLTLAHALLVWLRDWPEKNVSLPDIYQKGPNAIRDRDTAGRLVGVLESHGWLKRVRGGAEVDGHYRRDAWEIVKENP